MDEEITDWNWGKSRLGERLQSCFKEKGWMVFLGLLAGQLLFILISLLFLKPVYEARTSLYVSNVMQTTSRGNMDINDITASQQLVNTYIALLEDESVVSQLSKRLTENFSIEELEECYPLVRIGDSYFVDRKALKKSITMEAAENTEILQISVKSKNREISAKVCAYVEEIAEGVFQSVIQAGEVNQIGQVEAGEEPVSLGLVEMGILGGAVGAALAVFALLVMIVLDARIQDVEDIKTLYQIPVLGVLPRYDMSASRNRYTTIEER